MPMILETSDLLGAASELRLAASAIQLAKDYMPPEQTVGFDQIIADSLEVSAKVKQLVKELEEEGESGNASSACKAGT